MLTLSIIIPVYNVERFLEQCLESVLAQTVASKEIICVNDGATDTSGTILDRYSEKHPDIKVIHKQNGNLASARNAGLKEAKGKYVVFIDSDDWLHTPDIYQSMVTALQKHDADLAMGNICKVFPDGKQVVEQFKMEAFVDKSFTHEDINPFDLVRRPCNKIYRRSFLQKYDITFPEEADRDQGAPFTLTCALNARKMTAVKDIVYYYRIHNNSGASLTSTRSDELFLSALRVNSLIIKDIITSQATGSQKDFLHSQNLYKLLNRITMVHKKTFSPASCYKIYRRDVLQYPFKIIYIRYLGLNFIRLYLCAVLCPTYDSYKRVEQLLNRLLPKAKR